MNQVRQYAVRAGVPAVAVAALIGGAMLWRQAPEAATLAPLVEPLPQDPYVQVYFNQSEANVYTEPYRGKTRFGDDLEQVIVDTINQAETSVDIAIQEIRLPRVAQALRDKHRAGVRVRVVIEHDYSRAWSDVTEADLAELTDRDRNKYEEFVLLADQNQDGQVSEQESSEFDALRILRDANVPLIDDTADGSKGSDLMHHKIIIVDGKTVLTGSTNFTTSGTHGDPDSAASVGNANSIVVINSTEVAQIFTQEFAYLWGDGPGGEADSLFGLQKPFRPARRVTLPSGTTVDVQFSPTSSSRDWQESVNGLIARSFRSGQDQIDLALFVFSDQAIADELEMRSRQGVEVRALIEPGFAYRDYSEALDMLGTAMPNNRCKYEEDNRPWITPISTVGVPTLAPGDVLHHKFGVVDGKTVVIGSQNFSDAANQSNDENLIVIGSPTVAAHYEREFERLYRTAKLGITEELRARIEARREDCE
ncbi:MAG: phospholipase D-like domain-containing protein [Thainema sp.]